jgi:hypothetical protein
MAQMCAKARPREAVRSNAMTEPDDELFREYDEVDGEDGWLTDPPTLTGAPSAFLSRLRAQEATWRALGVTMSDTFLGYGDGRLRIGVRRIDHHDRLVVGGLRVDVTEAAWAAGWVSEPHGDEPTIEEAHPAGLVGGPIADTTVGAAEAIGWLEAELRSPLVRYRRRDGDEKTAGSWELVDTWPRPERDDRSGDAPWFLLMDDADTGSERAEPLAAGAASDLLRRLRSMAPLWSALEIEPGGTEVRVEDGRARATVELVDSELDTVYAVVRVDVDDVTWSAGWVHPFSYDASGLWAAGALGEEGGAIAEVDARVDAATGWLVTELRRPVTRRTWRRDGAITDCWWTVEGTGVETIVSDPPYDALDPTTAHATATVRTTPDDEAWTRAQSRGSR